jgi:hypothetical protein
MVKLATLFAAAALGATGAAVAAPPAQAQLQIQVQSWSSGPAHHHRGQPRHGWRRAAPQGYFTLNAQACAPLRDYYARPGRGAPPWAHSRGRGQTVRCSSSAFQYVPTRADVRNGYDARRMSANSARWDARSNQFVVDTRHGAVPVRIVNVPRQHYAWRR